MLGVPLFRRRHIMPCGSVQPPPLCVMLRFGGNPMRKCWIAILLLAACQQKPREITFDGAAGSETAGMLRHGERLTYVLGCRGCHGKNLQGTFFTKDEPQYGPFYASNLTVEVPEYSDAQLDGI